MPAGAGKLHSAHLEDEWKTTFKWLFNRKTGYKTSTSVFWKEELQVNRRQI